MCVPNGQVKLGGSKWWSAVRLGSIPSGRLFASDAASATSWIVTPAPDVPATEKRPPRNSRSSSAASSRWAAIARALAATFPAATCTATPPTRRLREP